MSTVGTGRLLYGCPPTSDRGNAHCAEKTRGNVTAATTGDALDTPTTSEANETGMSARMARMKATSAARPLQRTSYGPLKDLHLESPRQYDARSLHDGTQSAVPCRRPPLTGPRVIANSRPQSRLRSVLSARRGHLGPRTPTSRVHLVHSGKRVPQPLQSQWLWRMRLQHRRRGSSGLDGQA